MEQFTDYLLFGASVDLRISYAVFAWIIENANRRYAATEQARDVCIALSEAALMTASLLQRIMAQVNRDAGYLNKTSTSTGTDAIVIREGEQEKARRIISDWVRSKASDVIRICDPYFSVDSLWILKIIKTEKPGCRVSIVMGRKHLKGKPNLVEDEFRRAWHTIADFDPPETDVVVAGVGEDGKAPIHERWILSHGTGLRIGTSLADIGSGRISEISTLSDEDVIAREQEIGQYATFEKRIQNGERIRYNSFSLP